MHCIYERRSGKEHFLTAQGYENLRNSLASQQKLLDTNKLQHLSYAPFQHCVIMQQQRGKLPKQLARVFTCAITN